MPEGAYGTFGTSMHECPKHLVTLEPHARRHPILSQCTERATTQISESSCGQFSLAEKTLVSNLYVNLNYIFVSALYCIFDQSISMRQF